MMNYAFILANQISRNILKNNNLLYVEADSVRMNVSLRFVFRGGF